MKFIIYSFKGNYENENKIETFKGEKEEIINELKNDKKYHMKVRDDVDYSLFLDIDFSESKIEHVIADIKNYIESLYEIELTNNDFKYSQNPDKKNTFRIVIPKYYTTIQEQDKIFSRFKKLNTALGVDLSVYRDGQFIRLPEQTKPNSKKKRNEIVSKHDIIKGDIQDFLMNDLSKESIEFNTKFDKKNLNLLYDPEQNKVNIDTDDEEDDEDDEDEDADADEDDETDTEEDNNFEEIDNLLKQLQDSEFNEYHSWIKIGLTINGLCSDLDGYELWKKHSERGDEKYIEREWRKNGIIFKNHWSTMKSKKKSKKYTINIIKKWIREDRVDTGISKYNFKDEFSTTTISKFFVKEYGHNFIYKNKQLYYFNKVYWKIDEEYIIINNIVKTEFYTDLLKEFQNYEFNMMKSIDKDNSKGKLDEMAKYKKQLVQLRGQKQREQFIKEMCNDLHKDIEFDTKPNLFAFNNKIFDLYQNKFIEAKPEQYISMTTGYDYDDKYDMKKIDELQSLLNEIFTNEEIRKLNLTILSTGLYGQNIEKFIVNSGCGGNGKGVLNELLLTMVGDYGYKLPSAVLLQPIKQGCNPEIASMNKKRVVVTVEPNQNEQIRTSTVKEITGGSEINARMAFSNVTKTILYCLFIMECNEKPKLDTTDDAMYRRLIEIPFLSQYVDKGKYDLLEEEQKKNIFIANSFYKSNKFKEDYKQALFMIVKDYFKIYKSEGLVIPKVVRSLTNEYMAVSDDIYEWVNDNFKKTGDKNDIIKLKEVYEVFKSSEYFSNLTKIDKRKYNYKYFCLKMESNFFMKKYITETKDRVKIMKEFELSMEMLE